MASLFHGSVPPNEITEQKETEQALLKAKEELRVKNVTLSTDAAVT